MKLDDVKKLSQKKYRHALGHFLLEGEHLVLELFNAAATQPYLRRAELFIAEHYQNWVTQHNHQGLKVTLIGDKAMAQICDTQTPQGIVAVVPFAPHPPSQQQGEKAIYLHEIQDPGNLGTILRTLAWFGGFRLLLSANSVDPYSPKVVRAGMGAIFHVPLEQGLSLEQAQQRYPRMACLDMAGERPSHASFADFDCYVFGNEARGVPKDALAAVNAQAFSIQGTGLIESLNLASAVNICVYELKR